MIDLPISEGAAALKIWYMNDSVDEDTQEMINNKADEIMDKAWREFENWLKEQGFEYVMGVIEKEE